jgi:hypothetical protein
MVEVVGAFGGAQLDSANSEVIDSSDSPKRSAKRL